MTAQPGFSVPEELLRPSAHDPSGRRRRRTPIDAARWAVGLLAMSWFLLVDAGAAVFVAFAVVAVGASVMVVRSVAQAAPAELRRRAVVGVAGGALAGALAGVVLASAIAEAQGRGFVYATAIIATVGGGALLVDARRAQGYAPEV